MAEYWTPLRPALLKLSKSGLLPDLTTILEDIGEPNFFRNALGAHRNEWAMEAPLGQVQRVARGVLGLARTLTCITCKRIPYLVDARDLGKGFGCDCPRSAGGPSLPHHASKSSKSETDR